MADPVRCARRRQDDDVELRGHIPAWIAGVIDAECNTSGGSVSRIERVVEILELHCRAKVREATVIQNVLRGNPMPAEPGGKVSA